MVTRVMKYASSRLNDGPFPDRYSSETGKMITFENRAVVGGHFALVRRLLSFECLVTDSSISLKLLVPDVKKETTNSSGSDGSNDGGRKGGDNGSTAAAVCPNLPIVLVLFVTLVYAIL